MKEEHKNLCLGVLSTLEKTILDDYSYFTFPAESSLGGDKTLLRQYREIIKEPRDLGMIIEKVVENIYTSIAGIHVYVYAPSHIYIYLYRNTYVHMYI
jgi:hypothetical protein